VSALEGLGDVSLGPEARYEAAESIALAFAAAAEAGDVEGMVALLADDAWLTMPHEPYEYQGRAAIAGFFDDRGRPRGANFKVVPTGANGQPAFGCYLPDAHAAIAHAYGLMVLTFRGDQISAITWFGDGGVIARFGLPRTLPT
jgi:ketosteroid isomerase-like protein